MAKRGKTTEAEIQENGSEAEENPPAVNQEAMPKAETGPVNSSVAEIAAALAAQMPEPQPHAIEAMRAETGSDESHEEAPQPSETPAPKKRGRPPGSKSKVSSKAQKTATTKPQETTAPAAPKTDYRMMGGTCAEMTFMIGRIIGGPEFEPQDKAPWMGGKSEREMLSEAYARYAEAKQMPDLPPGVALSFALLIYVSPRVFQGPVTKSRFRDLGIWIKSVWAKWRGKKVVKNAQPNPRNDDERKDAPSESNSAVSESDRHIHPNLRPVV